MPVETSQEIDQLVKALIEFQSKVVTVERTVTNPFFRSKYADLASIMLQSQPILTECGLCISQFPDHLTNQLELQPSLTTILMHSSGQFLKATIPLPISRVSTEALKEKTQKTDEKTVTTEGFDPQEFGRAITYMRRYGYAAVIQIVIDEDDDGNKSSNRQVAEKPIETPSNPEIVEKIKSIWKENGGTEEQLDIWVKKNNNGLPLEQASGSHQQALLKVLESKKAEKQAKEPAAVELPPSATQPEQPSSESKSKAKPEKK